MAVLWELRAAHSDELSQILNHFHITEPGQLLVNSNAPEPITPVGTGRSFFHMHNTFSPCLH